MPDKKYMSQDDAARIQAAQAKSGGDMSSGGFAARAQAAAAQNANAGAGSGQTSGSGAATGNGGTAGKK